MDLEKWNSLIEPASEDETKRRMKVLGPWLESLTFDHRNRFLSELTSEKTPLSGWLAIATELCARPPGSRPPAYWSKWIDFVLDSFLGIRYAETEKQIPSNSKSDRAEAIQSELGLAAWSGSGRLAPSALNTPYSELFWQMELLGLPEAPTVVDLGCAYGRLGYVTSALFLRSKFFGYEIVKPRALACKQAAQFLGVENRTHFECADLSSSTFQLPRADLYYLYDPVNTETLLVLLQALRKLQLQRRSFQILARGRTGELQELLFRTPWLKLLRKPNQGEMSWSHYQTRDPYEVTPHIQPEVQAL